MPTRIDTDVPHPSRMHDYWLGGGHNFAADRELAEKIMKIMPGIEDISRINQAYVRRAALFLVSMGIRQFLDIGSGVPTIGTLHEVVHRADPECRVVYVDADPVSVAHTQLILEDVDRAAVLLGDVRDVDAVLGAEPTRRLLDVEAPIGLFAPAMHFYPDALDPAAILAGYRQRLASGSYLVLAQCTSDNNIPGQDEVVAAYRATRYRLYLRTYAEVLRMCEGFDLVPPGLVGFADWRPEGIGDRSTDPAINSLIYAAVGRKP
ncbi:MAG: SAM-dependent methyltransferase [Labedaea sp.]